MPGHASARLAAIVSILAIAHGILGCAAPQPAAPTTAREVEPGERSTLIGIARNGKAGAAVIVDGAPVYVAGASAWPESWVGQRVAVTGTITTRQGLPPGTTVGGIVGPYQVIEHASWRLAGADSHPAPIFQYTASDGEFSYGLELFEDRTWRRSEHSGTATPSGRLSHAAMRRFQALLRSAPFRLEPRACDDDLGEPLEHAPDQDAPAHHRARATYTDASTNRSLQTEPCFAADATTLRLVNCLEVLAAGDDSEAACRPDATPRER